MLKRIAVIVGLGLTSGCGVEQFIFPIVEEPEYLASPPATMGPYVCRERRVELTDLGDGEPGGIIIFEPTTAPGKRPLLVWVLGVNNRAWFAQSFHEYMASWGYVDVVPDTRDINFLDSRYHSRNVDNALNALEKSLNGELGVAVDSSKASIGGYSVGGSLAAFGAAEDTRLKALVMWAPAPSPFWQGVDPGQLLPGVVQPSLFVLAELDNVTPADEWPAEMMGLMTQSPQSTFVIPGGVHLYFQQYSGVDDRNPATSITRSEQLKAAFEQSRAFLDAKLGVVP